MTITGETPRECLLLVDDDDAITGSLAIALERPGRTTVVCSDVDAAEIALAHRAVTHVVADVQFSGAFGFEGLHFLGRLRARAPECRAVLMTGNATDALREAARQLGAAAVLNKPFETAELEAALQSDLMAHAASAPYETIRIPSIEEFVSGDELTTVFQPIVRLDAGGSAPFAFEALTRVRGNWLAGGPAALFEYAERRSRLADLNLGALGRAIEAAAALPRESAVFINVDPATFGNRSLARLLAAASDRASVSPSRIVLEITERSAFDAGQPMTVFDELRKSGVRFALDDHGSAYSHLSVIDRIRPSFIKISQAFGTGFENDTSKERVVRHIVALAADFGCEAILEGIESAATASAAAAAGITLVQGYHFGRPSAASATTQVFAA